MLKKRPKNKIITTIILIILAAILTTSTLTQMQTVVAQSDNSGSTDNSGGVGSTDNSGGQNTDVCHAFHVRDIGLLAALLAGLHIITLGASTAAILAAAASYCGG